MGGCPTCQQAAVAFAQADVGLPAEGLACFGWGCQVPWERPTALRGIALGPGARHAGATGMGLPGCGERPLPTPLPTGGCRRGQPHITHAWSGRLKAGEGTQGGHSRAGDGARHAAQSLPCCAHRVEAPGFALRVECLCEPLQPFRRFMESADRCLEPEGRRRSRPDALREPPEVSRVPGSLARRAAVVPQPAGLQPQLGGVAITEPIVTSPPPSTPGFIFNLGDLDGCEGACAPQPGQLERISAGRFDPIARCLRAHRRGTDPAIIAFAGQLAIEPRATRPRCVAKDQACGLRWQVPNPFSAIALARAYGAEIDNRSSIVLGGRGNREGCFMDSQANIKRARLCHG